MKRQQGYILVLVLSLLAALMAGSVQFFARNATGAQISNTARDHEEVALLAENAANLVLGRFMYGGDLNADGIVDNTQLRIDPSVVTPAPHLPYVFGVSSGAARGMDQTRPSLLQRVADGEAHATATPDSGAYSVAPQIIKSDTARLRVAQLFEVGTPLLYVADTDGTLRASGDTWSGESSARKAAVWLEIVREPTDDAFVRLYVQSSAQINGTRAHIQRFAGFVHTNVLGNLGALTESSTQIPASQVAANH